MVSTRATGMFPSLFQAGEKTKTKVSSIVSTQIVLQCYSISLRSIGRCDHLSLYKRSQTVHLSRNFSPAR